MTPQQIAVIYDSFPEGQQDIPREQFIKRVIDAQDPNKMAADVDRIVRGRVQKAVIDRAIK